ncbi:beta-1,3-galactosyltransferase 5-like [Haliotis cracherodii]|uniref:beta-1,3-galactosyltransferase 5-like n=1 Tax=Haliotis cracherodii TaxID=6455 RepID=UPI0039EC876C
MVPDNLFKTNIMVSKYRGYLLILTLIQAVITLILIQFAVKYFSSTVDLVDGIHTRSWVEELTRPRRSYSTNKYKTSRQSADPNFKIVSQNRDLCTSSARVHALFVVHTTPSNRKRRDVIRDMLTSDVINRKYTIRILFLIGWPVTFVRRTQDDVREETKQHGDILQGRFIDTYRNLTYKAVFGFKWISRHCKNVTYVIKMDDDVYVDMHNFFYTLYPKFEERHAVVCIGKSCTSVERQGQWMLDEYTYRHYSCYPVKYCNGYAVVFKGDMVSILYKASLMAPFFWIDDIFIYGTSRSFLRYVPITYVQTSMYFQTNGSKTLGCFKYTKPCDIIFSTNIDDFWELERFRRSFLKNQTKNLL